MVRPEGVEPPAYRFEACRSIQLSYGRNLTNHNRGARFVSRQIIGASTARAVADGYQSLPCGFERTRREMNHSEPAAAADEGCSPVQPHTGRIAARYRYVQLMRL
jgi:hypothetical protein